MKQMFIGLVTFILWHFGYDVIEIECGVVVSKETAPDNYEKFGLLQEWKDRAEKAEILVTHYCHVETTLCGKLNEYIDKTRKAEAENKRLRTAMQQVLSVEQMKELEYELKALAESEAGNERREPIQ